MTKKINWWIVAAIIIICVPIGYVIMELIDRMPKEEEPQPPVQVDTTQTLPPDTTVVADSTLLPEEKDKQPVVIEPSTENVAKPIQTTTKVIEPIREDVPKQDNKVNEKDAEAKAAQAAAKAAAIEDAKEAANAAAKAAEAAKAAAAAAKAAKAKVNVEAAEDAAKAADAAAAKATAAKAAALAAAKVAKEAQTFVSKATKAADAAKAAAKEATKEATAAKAAKLKQDAAKAKAEEDAKKAEDARLAAEARTAKLRQDEDNAIKQAVIAGKSHSKVQGSCKVVVNKKSTMDYQNFKMGVNYNAFTNVKDVTITRDGQGKVTQINVTATENKE